jgi:hypothetical protein
MAPSAQCIRNDTHFCMYGEKTAVIMLNILHATPPRFKHPCYQQPKICAPQASYNNISLRINTVVIYQPHRQGS